VGAGGGPPQPAPPPHDRVWQPGLIDPDGSGSLDNARGVQYLVENVGFPKAGLGAHGIIRARLLPNRKDHRMPDVLQLLATVDPDDASNTIPAPRSDDPGRRTIRPDLVERINAEADSGDLRLLGAIADVGGWCHLAEARDGSGRVVGEDADGRPHVAIGTTTTSGTVATHGPRAVATMARARAATTPRMTL
jgi:hypothetical protein